MGSESLRVLDLIVGILCVNAIVLAGCSGDPSLDEGAHRGPDHSFGLLTVQYLADGLAAEPELEAQSTGLEVTATAQFVRYNAMETEQVARVLALPFDPAHDLPAMDTCGLYHLTTDLTDRDLEGEQGAEVELLEAGELAVDAGSSLTLVPKYFPGLVPFVSGVVYGEAQATQASPPHRVTATSDGSEAIEAFRTEGISPDPLLLEPLTDSRSDGGVALRWQATAQTRGGTDLVTYVEVKAAQASGQRAVRCRMQDDGAFEIDAEVLALLQGDARVPLVLEAGRIRELPFAAEGLDSAKLRLSAAERLPVPQPE